MKRDELCAEVDKTSARKKPGEGGAESQQAMSTIEQVRAAEKRVREVTEALKNAGAPDPDDLSNKLKDATDEYARALRELKSA